MRLLDFFSYAHRQQDEDPLYMFDPGTQTKFPATILLHYLLIFQAFERTVPELAGHYRTPPYFADNLLKHMRKQPFDKYLPSLT